MDDLYEPRHLLKFTGDPELQLYYRSLIYSFPRKDVSTETDEHQCHVCNTVLSTEEGTRLKPAQRMTRTIQKLMVKKSRKIPLNRIEIFKLKKFMDSSQQMVVKCPECTVVNKMSVIGRRDVIKFKSKLISEVKEAAKLRTEEERGEKMDVAGTGIVKELGGNEGVGEVKGNDEKKEEGTESATGGKKKKKKKNKSKKAKDFIGTLIQQKASEQKKSKKKKKSVSTPVSLRDFVLTETKETLLSSPIEVLRNVFHSSDTSYQQTPVCMNDSTGKQKHSQSATTTITTPTTPSSKKSKKKSKNKKDFSKTLFFETPENSNNRSKTKTSQTPVSARSVSSLNTSTNTPQQLPSTTSKRGKKKAIQKELRKFLTSTETPPHLQEKSSSLKDFLISL